MIAGFDWDGTLVDSFTGRPLPGVADRLAALPAGVRTFVATNQAGPIYRALTGQSHYPTVGDLVDAMTTGLAALGWRPDLLLVCVAPAPAQFAESDWRRAASEVVAAYDVPGVSLHVTARPDWRKPQPGMLHAAAAHFDVGPAALTYVGDMDGDRLAAETAGARFVHAAAWREGAEL